MHQRWQVYWASLTGVVLAVAFWANWKRYKQRGWKYTISKTLADTILLAVLAAFCPALLTGLCVMWIADAVIKAERPATKLLITIVGGLGLATVAGVFLEGVLLLGVFSMDILSGEWIQAFERRHTPKNTPTNSGPLRRVA